MFRRQKEESNTALFTTMLIFGLFGLLAAFVLTLDKFHLLENPDATLACSINLVLNCSAVMQTPQASVFGFPNMLIGLMAFPLVIMLAVAGLARVKFPRWFMIAANSGIALGALFAYWLFFQSLYVIQVLCPWCLVVTFSMTMILATVTHYNLKQNNFRLSKSANKRAQLFLNKDFDKLLIASWIVLLISLVILKFGQSLFA